MPRRWITHVTLWFGVWLLLPMLLTAAQSKPKDAPQTGSLAGQLLVATPEMGDPRFRRSVILLVRHDRTGALGVIINRPVETMPMARLMAMLGLNGAGISGEAQLYAGGPVQPRIGFVVHSAEYERAGTVNIDGRVAMTTNPQALRDIARHEGPRQSLIAFGYAGWGPGQLENEIAQGAWFTVPEEPKLVFDFDRDELWKEMQKRRTFEL
jgi:putative transcriptional regulator